MKRGYTAQIGNEFVFVEAKDIAKAVSILKKKAGSEHWLLDKTKQYRVI